MKIKEIVKEDVTAQTEPAPDEIAAVQQLLGTIDPQREKPESLLNKLTSWMTAHPLLDKITDLIPQTRIVKAVAMAVDALENNDKMTALNSLASVLTGSVGKAVNTVARTANTATALAQNNLQGAAMAAGGTVGKVARAVNTVDKVQTALSPRAPDEVERVKQLANV